MRITPTTFRIECDTREINIIHKALTILKDNVKKPKSNYRKGSAE